MRFERIRNPRYTDLAIFLGPNVRWVEYDFEDLQRFYPEVLLGYRVKLAVPSTRLWGYRPEKLVTCFAPMTPEYERAILEARICLAKAALGGKWEHWHIHRARGIFRMDRVS